MDFNKKTIFGMIHLSGDYPIMISRALEEIAIYQEEGLFGCIIENYHGSIDDVEAVLIALGTKDFNIKIGINILPNQYDVAFALANKYSVHLIQLDYVSGNYVGRVDSEIIKIDNDDYIKHLITLPPYVKVFGGVWPKYYTPVEGSDLEDDIINGLLLSDGIVVTGEGTGKETPLDKIKQFRKIIQSTRKFCRTPLIIGAGLDTNNVAEQLKYADGAIVGSCFKPYKRTQEMISRELVKEFMNEVKKG